MSQLPSLSGADAEALESYRVALLRQVAATTKKANALPKGGDYSFHATSTGFRTRLDSISARLHTMMEAVIKKVDASAAWDADGLRVIDDDERAESVVETTDMLLERVDLALDEVRQAQQGGASSAVATSVHSTTFKSPKSGTMSFMHARNIKRPQMAFPDAVDNSAASAFVPKLVGKPNALVPLDLKPIPLVSAAESAVLASHVESLGLSAQLASKQAEGPLESYPHPYQHELSVYEPGEHQLTVAGVTEPLGMAATPFTWVADLEALDRMKTVLDSVDEIAIDLEAHNYRAYDSFCCLMQISTRTEDYLVDSLALRGSLHVLNSAFTNPAIVKVLHGADRDIMWLQKDLGLYLVNMFDTGQATRVLAFPRFSLAYLLKHYCDIDADKQYQVADWRIRPLPDEMTHYAREDTHSLLFIYDKLRNELIERGNAHANLLRAVWMQSRDLCLQKYEKPLYRPDGVYRLLEKHNRSFSAKQLAGFKALHAWRDKVAREEDESTEYVLPNHMLFQLADICPKKIQLVIACCQKGHKKASGVPPLVRLNAHIIVEVINTAVAAAAAKVQSDAASGAATPAKSNPGSQTHRHSTAALSKVTFAVARAPSDVDVDALRVPLANASRFARLVSETNHQKGMSYEAIVKALDVQKAFGAKRLFGPPLQLAAMQQRAKAAQEAAAAAAQQAAATAAGGGSPAKRKAADDGGNSMMVLSKMPRTTGSVRRKKSGSR